MKKKIIIFVFLFTGILLLSEISFCEERNPFKHRFPIKKEIPVSEALPEVFIEPEIKFDPSIFNVEGIIWGAYKPKAIINNKIYGVGDKLQEAHIIDIDKDGVVLKFEEEEYIIKPRQAIEIKQDEEIKGDKNEDK